MASTPAHESDGTVRIGRSYTRARRFPWVVGKIQGWQIPFGPYTATQLGVLIAGIWILVQTFSLWSRLGPLGLVCVAMPPAATWAVRHAKIDGRTPIRALGGYAALLLEPSGGQIAGRQARDRRPTRMTGSVRLSAPPTNQPAAAADAPLTARSQPSRSSDDGPRRATPPPARQRPARRFAHLDSVSLPQGAGKETAQPPRRPRHAVVGSGPGLARSHDSAGTTPRTAPAPTGLQALLSAAEKPTER